ncbi:malate synthase A [Fulvivirga sp. M361]|uniref:malate synthase A n=1 Tax=Fulvivirga sp. M361 TaxID=2594266 RepID=UPI0011798B72|nr:malate synthase A [Fulvivirga sp. M361]TRX48568.1 malate synthase A [Fulvivirga sp. M361]
MNTSNVTISGLLLPGYETILTEGALKFVSHMHETFNARREALLAARDERQKRIDLGEMPDFLPETESVRTGEWQVNPLPDDLQDRRTEITGPVDRKMVVNALNSGAKVFMADFEDANSPTWKNTIDGQINLFDAIRRQIDFTAPNGKEYKLKEETAVLKVRPRGWHLVEKHVLVDGVPVSASIFDFGLFFFHNARQLIANGSGPYFYLPKMESHLEARLWNEIFKEAQRLLDIPSGTVKVTVLIETILAAFEMEEIIYELREHMAGLNAGRWDYIFSIVKKFRNHPQYTLPDRAEVTMTVPFMRSYAQLLAKTCHKRGAHAMGGMSAFIPSRSDEEVNRTAFEKVKADKKLEASTGYDGTWVAHPDLVPVAMEEFNEFIGTGKHQKEQLLDDVQIQGEDLINFSIEGAKITEAGLRMNINVGILYIESWLMGVGAAALYNLMEDAATAEISRAQVWQWLHNPSIKLEDGRAIDEALCDNVQKEELAKIKDMVGQERYEKGRFREAAAIFDHLVKTEEFVDFLTLKAYDAID